MCAWKFSIWHCPTTHNSWSRFIDSYNNRRQHFFRSFASSFWTQSKDVQSGIWEAAAQALQPHRSSALCRTGIVVAFGSIYSMQVWKSSQSLPEPADLLISLFRHIPEATTIGKLTTRHSQSPMRTHRSRTRSSGNAASQPATVLPIRVCWRTSCSAPTLRILRTSQTTRWAICRAAIGDCSSINRRWDR